MLDASRISARFVAEYGRTPRVFSAPGRVNLIGEHTDYNDGFVLPLAIAQRTFVAAAARDDRRLRVHAVDVGERAEVDLDAPGTRPGGWLAYVEGVARVLDARGQRLTGADLTIASDVPIGAGLSSSAALEVAVGLALTTLAGVALTPVDLALAAQAAEHEYAGTKCGIMDQYVVALARLDHALFIDCRSLVATAVPADLGGAALLVCDSRVKHDLSASTYNELRAACERGAAWFARDDASVRALRDVALDAVDAARGLDAETRRRCRHVVSENARTVAAVEALRSGDLREMGRLMTDSHASLARDYEVSCPELDVLVEVATAHPAVYGSRLTGAGFGGCTVTLVERDAVAEVAALLVSAEEQRFGRTPRTFVTSANAGAREEA